MITLECAWCDAELTLDELDATTIECADCRIVVEISPDPGSLALAA
jgi:hypothetical protein